MQTKPFKRSYIKNVRKQLDRLRISRDYLGDRGVEVVLTDLNKVRLFDFESIVIDRDRDILISRLNEIDYVGGVDDFWNII